MKINCIIVEDEPLAMERAREYVAKLPYLHLMATFDNGADAMVYLRLHTVQLILLDINIPGISGIQLLETANTRCEVVLITAYEEYALKGYELNVTDYLLKPYTFDRFVQAMDKVLYNLQRQAPAAPAFIFIKTSWRLEKVALDDILYIEGRRDYRKVYTQQKQIMTLQPFGWFEKELPPAQICRVHKSYMVAVGKIDSIEKEGIRIAGITIPVSETYRKQFYALITRG
ncbi:LytR/AlgR family response regulator transcription factor [Chitinophaga qingshengii]|uniref:Response regulator transcription factor n=1 Tax=Chitinophaga qingshengii TaxID=1569794 RepID=A0ABR7TXQ6_9BACT|nr:LytTR family DNA-binding domain-containing protein [Chitinophaga qingshengii]MBC9934510.1 response regulator transcription factor [Chitinophaga qingshengii]